MIKRLLRKYGYPPDQQKIATDLVLEQAKIFAEDWAKDDTINKYAIEESNNLAIADKKEKYDKQ